MLLEELWVHGVAVPSRLSVTGCDGFGTLAEPYFGFSTFRLPVDAIGTRQSTGWLS